MQLRQGGWLKSTIFTTIILGMLAATPQALRADEHHIFGLLTGLGCQGANSSSFPGFAASTFSLSDQNGASGTGAGTGKPTFPDITVVKGLDDCTPLLFGAVAKGTQFNTVTLTVVPKGSSTALLVIELKGVLATSDNFTEGAAGELDEVVTLSYTKITITHIPSGKTFTFDVATGAA